MYPQNLWSKITDNLKENPCQMQWKTEQQPLSKDTILTEVDMNSVNDLDMFQNIIYHLSDNKIILKGCRLVGM